MSTDPGHRDGPRHRMVSPVLRTATLALMWAALWGDFSGSTLLAGALVAISVQLAFPALAPRPSGRVNVVAVAKLGVVFAWMLVTANLAVTRRVFSPRLALTPRVVRVQLPTSSDAVATVVANAVTLTPGTLTLDAARTPDGVVLSVHNLDADDPETVRADVLALYELAAAAFPTGARAGPAATPPSKESPP